MINVSLSDGEQIIAHTLAYYRTKNNRDAHIPTTEMVNMSADDAELWGVGAEIAAAKLLNLCPDLTLHPRKGGYDMRTKKYTIDIKHTRFNNGGLIVPERKKLEDSDLYILAIGAYPNYIFVGWEWAKNIIQKKNMRKLARGYGYYIDQRNLIPIELLLEYMYDAEPTI